MSADYTTLLVQSLNHFFNMPQIDLPDEIFATQFVAHVPLLFPLSHAGFRGFVQALHGAFPDLHMVIEDSMMMTNRLVLRTTFYGTHQGSFLGIPASGCAITIPSISIFRTSGRLIIESWTEMDILGAIQQISVNTSPIAAIAPPINCIN